MGLRYLNSCFGVWIFTVGAMERNPELYTCQGRVRIREQARQQYVDALMEANLEGLK